MIRVLQRALAVLECFKDETPKLSLQEISRTIGLPKTTTFRILATLVESGYLLHLANQDYALSHKLMQLASVAQNSLGIRDLAHPLLERLATETGETVELSVLDGDHRVCLDAVESSSSLKSIITPGYRLPLVYGATGKVFLAHMSAPAINAVVRAQSKAGEIDVASLKRTLTKIKKQGFAMTRDERVLGAAAIAAPVWGHDRRSYCLTVTGPSARFDGREKPLRELIVEGAAHLSNLFGASQERAG